ncbi:CDP-alcohol phosphatidyltransferase family protein [Halorarum halobium]|uniref:CDP-alcohol phosphatidyltransferase family protein n=1 Tax=Halorarum halobium TaxID=3075121 RepID=UPI0028A62295|nr:CDP-alcohol phosphatidyltransferase family protein [Halobaculum sp. XH14]
MSDEPNMLRGITRRLDARNGWAESGERTSVLTALTGADYLSLVALFVGWVGALLFLSNEPNWAIVTTFGAFLFDKLDGYWARRRGTSSAFGRGIDSFIDVFAYLVPGALLFHYELAPNGVLSAVVGFAVLAFGGLRLVRHTAEGFESRDSVRYYHGTTVVHTNAVVLANYVLLHLIAWWNGWIATALILAAAPLMVSEYRAPKTTLAHALLGVLVVAVTAVCLAIEFGAL